MVAATPAMATSKVKQQEFTPSEIRPGTNVIPGKLNSSIKSPTAAYEHVGGLLSLIHTYIHYTILYKVLHIMEFVSYSYVYYYPIYVHTIEVDLADEGQFIVEVFVEYVVIDQPEELSFVRPLHLIK